jgi:hypothetical protein
VAEIPATAGGAQPIGTPKEELGRVRDRVIQRYTEGNRLKDAKQQLIAAGLREIYPCLKRFEAESARDDEEFELPFAIERNKQPIVREALDKELEGNETSEEAARIVKQVLGEELDMENCHEIGTSSSDHV